METFSSPAPFQSNSEQRHNGDGVRDEEAIGDVLELIGDSERRLDAIESALHKLADGNYGRCEACDAAIDSSILASDAAARLCATHASQPTTRQGAGSSDWNS